MDREIKNFIEEVANSSLKAELIQLFSKKEASLTLKRIASSLGKSPKIISKELKELEKAGVIRKESRGKLVAYVYAPNKSMVETIEKFLDYFATAREFLEREILKVEGKKKEIAERVKEIELLDKSLLEREREISILQKLSKATADLLNLEETLGQMLNILSSELKVKIAFISLFEDKSPALFVSQRLKESLLNKIVPKLEEIYSQVSASGKPLIFFNIKGLAPLEEATPKVRLKTLLNIPLIREERIRGVLSLGDKTSGEMFSRSDLALLSLVAEQVMLAIGNVRIRELALRDGLTKLYAYRYFQERLGEELRRARRYNSPLSLIMLDIDHFKKVNDAYGRKTGNIVLKGLAEILLRDTRGVDLVARYGGEEIAIILPETDLPRAKIVAERLRKRVEECEFPKNQGEPLRITVSLGVAILGSEVRTEEDFIKKADQALYRAKEQGRNRVAALYTPEV